jgi:ABC-type protease/lipase transport system fused ATPase/permease subunit
MAGCGLHGRRSLSRAIFRCATPFIGSRALAPIEGAIEGWRSLVSALQLDTRLIQILLKAETQSESIDLPEPKGEIRTCLAPISRTPIIKAV